MRTARLFTLASAALLVALGCNGLLGIEDPVFVGADGGSEASALTVTADRPVVRVQAGKTSAVEITVEGAGGEVQLEAKAPPHARATTSRLAPNRFRVEIESTGVGDGPVELTATEGDLRGTGSVRALTGRPGTVDVTYGKGGSGYFEIAVLSGDRDEIFVTPAGYVVLDADIAALVLVRDDGTELVLSRLPGEECFGAVASADDTHISIAAMCSASEEELAFYVGSFPRSDLAALPEPVRFGPSASDNDLAPVDVTRVGGDHAVVIEDLTQGTLYRGDSDAGLPLTVFPVTRMVADGDRLVMFGTRSGRSVVDILDPAQATPITIDPMLGAEDIPGSRGPSGELAVLGTRSADGGLSYAAAKFAPDAGRILDFGAQGNVELGVGQPIGSTFDREGRFLVLTMHVENASVTFDRYDVRGVRDETFRAPDALTQAALDPCISAGVAVDDEGMIVVHCTTPRLNRVARIWP